MYARKLLKFYKLVLYNADSILKNTIFVAEIVPNNFLNVTNMNKTVVFDLPAWAALSTILDEYLKKCSHCNKVGSSQCFREPLLRAKSALNAA